MRLDEAKAYTKWLAQMIALSILALWAVSLLAPTDNSDRSRFGRSGVSVRTDALTGCQYLESQRGSLIVRVDGTGQHVGCYKATLRD